MKKHKLLWIAGILLLATGSVIAQRGPGYGQGTPGGNRMLMGIPDLTEDQITQMKELHTAHLKDILPLNNDLRINNAKLQALQTEDEPDLKEINGLIEKNGNLRTELLKKKVAHKMEIRSLLTDDQKVFFDNRMQRMRYASRGNFKGKDMRPGRDARPGRGAGQGRGYGGAGLYRSIDYDQAPGCYQISL